MIPTSEFAQIVAQEIMFLFEERFVAIEEQILTLRRFTARNQFRNYGNEAMQTILNYHSNAQISLGTTTQEFQVAFQNASDCYSFMLSRVLLDADSIARSREPEFRLYEIQEEWKTYFAQKGINLPEPFPVEEPQTL